MFWINFLHFYQPPSVNKDTIDAVVKNSYSFIVKILKENKRAKISANINASLLEHLDEYGYHALIRDINKLAEEGRIELVLSAAYHPVLALVPLKEALRQIKISKEVYKKFFPKVKIAGFFFPEMVYDKKVAKELKKMGIKWIILDEIAYRGKLDEVDNSKRYIDKNSGLEIIFRNRNFSRKYTPKVIRDLLDNSEQPESAITATDAELYGDRHVDFEGDFFYAVREKKIKCETISQFLKNRKEKESVSPKIASWDTDEDDFSRGNALNLWKNPSNEIHKKLWELTDLTLELVEKNKSDEGYEWARWRLDRGLSSCVYWWASEKDFAMVSKPAWHPDQIIAGADDLIKSVRSLSSISAKDKLKAERIYLKIEELVWKRHWEKYYKKTNGKRSNKKNNR